MKKYLAIILSIALLFSCVSFALSDGDLFEITDISLDNSSQMGTLHISVKNQTGASVHSIQLTVCFTDDKGNIIDTTFPASSVRVKDGKSIIIDAYVKEMLNPYAVYVDQVQYSDSSDEYHKVFLDDTEEFQIFGAAPIQTDIPSTPVRDSIIGVKETPTPNAATVYEVLINGVLRKGTYTGDSQNDKPNGEGLFVSTDDLPALKYEGNWADGRPVGKGLLKDEGYPLSIREGDEALLKTGKYDGETIDGIPAGHGTFSATNSEGIKWTYTGAFKNGTFNGYGETVWDAEGATVEKGNYTDGKFDPSILELISLLVEESNGQLYESGRTFIDQHEDLFTTIAEIDSEWVYDNWNVGNFKNNPQENCEKLVHLSAAPVIQGIDTGTDVMSSVIFQDDSGNFYVGVCMGQVDFSENSVIDDVFLLPIDWLEESGIGYVFCMLTPKGMQLKKIDTTPEPTPAPTPEPTTEPEPEITPEPTAEPTEVPAPTPVLYELPANADRSVAITAESMVVNTGNQQKLKAEVTVLKDEAPSQSAFEWTSSDENVAKVNAQGVVTGVGPGYAIITCCLKDNPEIRTSSVIKVLQPVKSVKVEETNIALLLGGPAGSDRGIVSVQILPENASVKRCVFVSSDESIVMVDDRGNLQAVGVGKAKISIAPDEEGTKVSAVCNVTVAQSVSSISVSASETIAKGQSFTLKPEILPTDATNKTLSYGSSDESVAKVSKSGVVSAVGCGNAVITCSAVDGSGVSAQCSITVYQAVKGIKLSENAVTVDAGKQKDISITIMPEDATNKNVKWKTSQSSVATVTQSGKITGIQGGDCEITCTTEDGEFVATVKVHVPSFSVNQTEYTVTSKKGITIPVIWASNDSLTLQDNGGTCFDANWVDGEGKINIVPNRAGKGSIVIYNENVPKDRITVSITIDHSAVYDNQSYPTIQYDGAMRYPDAYKGDHVSFSGKVLQVMSDSTTTTYRISSRGNYDDVVYVTINNTNILTPVIEDDRVTVYGIHDGNETYTAVWGNAITIPKVKAERIVVK